MNLSKKVILKKLQKIQDSGLFMHSKATARMAVRLAVNLNKKNPLLKIDIGKIETASLLHDWAKGLTNEELVKQARKNKIKIDGYELKNPVLLHGAVGAAAVKKELGVKDKAVLSAIKNHTTGDREMSVFDKILFVADHVEVNRDYHMVDEIRRAAVKNFDKAVTMVMENKIRYVLECRAVLHPKTISAWNDAVKKNCI